MGPAPRRPVRREVKDIEATYEKDGFPKIVKKDCSGRKLPPETQRGNGILMSSRSTQLINASEINLTAWGDEAFILALEAKLHAFLIVEDQANG